MTTGRAGFLRQYFYFFMSLLIAGVVVFGFSQTIDHNLIHPHPATPWILYLHAPVFSDWVLFFILQSVLIRTRNVRVHRTLGWFGVALAVLMIGLGLATAVSMDNFFIHTDGSFPAASFLIVQVMDLICFAVPFGLAIFWRRRPEFHRRLMLISTCALTDAAFGRFPHLPLIWSPAGVDVLILCGVLRDLIVDRRVHTVYLYALPAFILIQIIATQSFIHQASWWLVIAQPFVH